MKVVHLNKAQPTPDLLKEEIRALEQTIKYHPTNEKAYSRLMIIYRKQQEYKKELKVINLAIKTFEEMFSRKQPAYNPRIKALSKALAKATGLTDKKGNSLYEKGELAKWKRRKATVMKKLKAE
jgi:DNA-binding SARP family transcriptional activator